MSIIQKLAQRVFLGALTLISVTFFLFLLMQAIPGDPAQLLLGERATPEALAAMRESLGLNRPLIVRYLLYLQDIVFHGDLGVSTVSGEAVWELLKLKVPATMELAFGAMCLALLVGVPMGIFAASRPGGWIDLSLMSGAVVGVSIPVFWLGLILMLVFGVALDWLPLSGRIPVNAVYEPVTGFLFWDALWAGDYALAWTAFLHLVLPSLTLSTIPLAFLARMTRAAFRHELRKDFVRTAYAKGVPVLGIYGKHVFRNAALPVLTVFGLQFGLLLGGAVLTETLFAWPGIGTLILDSVNARDIPALEGGVLTAAFGVVISSIIVDCLICVLDPRVGRESL